jgi:hypothetical protein
VAARVAVAGRSRTALAEGWGGIVGWEYQGYSSRYAWLHSGRGLWELGGPGALLPWLVGWRGDALGLSRMLWLVFGKVGLLGRWPQGGLDGRVELDADMM